MMKCVSETFGQFLPNKNVQQIKKLLAQKKYKLDIVYGAFFGADVAY